QPLQTDGGAVDERHGRGDRLVAGHLGDLSVHLVGDGAIGGMALRARAQLDEVHRLARVHLDGEADAVGHADGVGRGGGDLGAQTVVQDVGAVHYQVPLVGPAHVFDGVRTLVAVQGRERLPLQRADAVTLEV